jgi:hypothetical protein
VSRVVHSAAGLDAVPNGGWVEVLVLLIVARGNVIAEVAPAWMYLLSDCCRLRDLLFRDSKRDLLIGCELRTLSPPRGRCHEAQCKEAVFRRFNRVRVSNRQAQSRLASLLFLHLSQADSPLHVEPAPVSVAPTCSARHRPPDSLCAASAVAPVANLLSDFEFHSRIFFPLSSSPRPLRPEATPWRQKSRCRCRRRFARC